MKKKILRNPYNYDGTKTTTHKMGDVLSVVLQNVGALHLERPDVVLNTWPEVIGSNLAPMTQAVAFVEGVLTVKVKNSSLYSLLSQHDKQRILQNMRQKCPHHKINNIVFRMG